MKKRMHLNWVDAVFVLFLLAAVCAAVLVFGSGSEEEVTDGQAVKLRYVVKIAELREELDDRITNGDVAYDSSGLYRMGTVIGSQSERSTYFSSAVTETVVGSDGESYEAPVSSSIPGKVDLYVTLEAEALLMEDGRYYVDGRPVCVGTFFSLMTQHFFGEGYCVSITEVN